MLKILHPGRIEVFKMLLSPRCSGCWDCTESAKLVRKSVSSLKCKFLGLQMGILIAFSISSGHQEVLRNEGKCSQFDPVPLVLVKDVMNYMPQMKYMFNNLNAASTAEPASKRLRVSWPTCSDRVLNLPWKSLYLFRFISPQMGLQSFFFFLKSCIRGAVLVSTFFNH